MTHRRTIGLALVLALFLAGAAQADISTISYTSAPFNSGVDGLGFAAVVPQFNPALGTLTGVSATLDLNLQLDPSVSVYNVTGHPVTVNLTTQVTSSTPDPFGWTDPYGNKGTVFYTYSVMDITAPVGLTDFLDPDWVSAPPLVSIVPTGSLGNYIGTGTYAVDYKLGGNINTSGTILSGGPGSRVFYGSDYEAAGTITVTYEYVPVPAPAAILLGLLGLSGLGLLMRRYA